MHTLQADVQSVVSHSFRMDFLYFRGRKHVTKTNSKEENTFTRTFLVTNTQCKCKFAALLSSNGSLNIHSHSKQFIVICV